MTQTYLTDIQVAQRYGIARPTVWRWHREKPDFPRVVRLSGRCARWKLSDIEAWESQQAEVAA
ncbi:helix-turn-helix transcriptional regulator [Roseovarius indicus]|uniref:Putative transcriptional regulator n=1 Tax=Roseovarius indicus TaxID=540747 RepID=A0A0T5PC48_9RHOB|nr:AlpA family phage regulatory protein [Roseovarius indicus]KRS18859.1 hypothetical protein XM52_04010 [Roseovarius indicus]QEW26225.1 putative transcriptional regulator [Roseovarius indicus]SFD95028.1 transcriptional regulator, AlpA family [Roseovarius indicus]